MSTLSISEARAKFPALNQPQVYFDNAGGSQTLGTVIESVHDYLSKTNVQMGSNYAVGLKSEAHYDAGYKAAAKHINASTDEIVLGSSTTQNFRNLSHALEFPAGSELIISKIDHEANIAPWVTLAARQKLTLKWWVPRTKENPKLEASDLKELLTEKTVLVTCTHASNILGTIHDIKAIAEAVHSIPGSLLAVDAVAYAPHRKIDVKELGVDFYCFSWYKVYGPHMSILYSSPAGLKAVQSLGHYFNPSTTLQHKLGLAGSSYELVASIPSVVSYLEATEMWAAIEKQEGELQSTLLTYLNGRPEVTICGEKDAETKKRVSTISFLVKGWKSKDFVEQVDEVTKGEMGIRWGGFYSVRLLEEVFGLGYDGVVRVSMLHYNTVDEVKQLLAIFDQILALAWQVSEQTYDPIPASAPIAASSSYTTLASGLSDWIEVLTVSNTGLNVNTWSGNRNNWIQEWNQPSTMSNVTASASAESFHSVAVTATGAAFAAVKLQGGSDAIQTWQVKDTSVDWVQGGNVDIGKAWS